LGDESSSEEEEDCTACEASVRNLMDKVSLLGWLKCYIPLRNLCQKTLEADGRPVGSWEETYRRCRDNHQHEDDFFDEPDELDEPDDDEDLEEADLNQGDEGGVAEVGAAELLAGEIHEWIAPRRTLTVIWAFDRLTLYMTGPFMRGYMMFLTIG
jgi:hypothetical protein